MEFHEGELDSADVRALLALHFANARGFAARACHVLPTDALRDPGIRFFSLRDEGVFCRRRRAQDT